MTFEQVPTFYRLASSAPVEEILTERALDRGQIGLQHLVLAQASGSNTFREELVLFREALSFGARLKAVSMAPNSPPCALSVETVQDDHRFPGKCAGRATR